MNMNMDSFLWLIPAAPLLGFLVNGGVYLYAGRGTGTGGGHHGSDAHGAHDDDDHGHAHAHPSGGPVVGLPATAIAAIGVAGPVVAFVLATLCLVSVIGGAVPASTYWSWIHTGNVDLGFGLRVDALTSVMLMFVTGIGSLIHLYSYGYMHEDPAVARFFAYLNLFLCSMLILIMGSSLPLMFVGWEGVGLCSYLLIGFWYQDLANVDAGRKAFIANRIGDFGFLLGMFTLFAITRTLDFQGMQHALAHASLAATMAGGAFGGWSLGATLTFAAFCLFIGATGKSAQIPLYVWLPDAMAGPTPVSALIHAATMVTAGVYMIGRLNFVFVQTPSVMAVIGFVAALTALLSGLIAVAQNDIKKVLAYSTISQLGYMFAGMATTVFSAGLFHVVTHAFFKALLFLGAGAVIHALGNEQDIRKMGGLWKDFKLVALLFGIGSLALAGVPPFAGFWSKDGILGNVYLLQSEQGGLWVATWWILIFTAALTAFYTTRLYALTFFGPPADPHRHPHAPHWTMTLPLLVLATLSVFGGALGGWLSEYTAAVWQSAAWIQATPEETIESAHHIAMAFSVGAVVLGIGGAAFAYGPGRATLTAFVEGRGAALHQLVLDKFRVDELYQATFVSFFTEGSPILWAFVDRMAIDQFAVEGSGKLVVAISAGLRRSQRGALSIATGAMVVGAVALLGYLLVHAVLQ